MLLLFLSNKLKSQERHAMLEKDHIKPDASTLDYEKNLMRIATRGGNCYCCLILLVFILVS